MPQPKPQPTQRRASVGRISDRCTPVGGSSFEATSLGGVECCGWVEFVPSPARWGLGGARRNEAHERAAGSNREPGGAKRGTTRRHAGILSDERACVIKELRGRGEDPSNENDGVSLGSGIISRIVLERSYDSLCSLVLRYRFGFVQSGHRPCGRCIFGFYVAGADEKLFNNATMVVMMREGTKTVLSMQNNCLGPPENFAMVVPVPVVLNSKKVIARHKAG